MAAEKKKVEKKANVKKTSEKKVSAKSSAGDAKKIAVKKSKQTTQNDAVTINVPSGGQVIKFFNLTPALPTTQGPGDWIFAEEGSTEDISNLIVRFPLNPSALERQFERAILVVQIQQNPETDGMWRFALGGVATFVADADPDNDIVVDIIDNGFTMLVYVQVLENSEEYIPFQFVASFTEKTTGAVSIFQSDDPGVLPRRP